MTRSDLTHLLPLDGSAAPPDAWRAVEALGYDAQAVLEVSSASVAGLARCLELIAQRTPLETVVVRARRDPAHAVAPQALMRALQTLGDEGLAHQPVLRLEGVPPCQVSLRAIRDLDVVLSPDTETPRAKDLAACARCPAAEGCPRPAAHASTTPVEPDLAQVAAVLARHAEVPRATPAVTELDLPAAVEATEQPEEGPPDTDTIPPPEGPPPITRIRVIDDPEVWFIIEEPRPQAHYWFRNTSLGVYFSDPPRPTPLFAKLEGLLGKVRRKIDRLPADRVRVEDLVAIAEWARKAMR